MDGRPSQKSGRGGEVFPEVQEGSGGPPGSPEGYRRPSCKSGRGLKHLKMSGRGLEAVLEVREGSVGPPGSPGGDRMLSRSS